LFFFLYNIFLYKAIRIIDGTAKRKFYIKKKQDKNKLFPYEALFKRSRFWQSNNW